MRGGLGGLGDRAADGRHVRHGHLLAREYGLDGVLQLAAAGRRVPHAAGDELVVDPAVIADLALGIEQERLGRLGRADLAREGAAAIAGDPEASA